MISIYLTFAVVSSIALDSSRILELRSDEAEQDINANLSTWMGNVIANQGPYQLFADTLRIEYNDANQPCILKAVGYPVRATGPLEGESVSAEGEVLVYDCNQQKVRLARSVVLEAPEQKLEAHNVIYHFIHQRLKATGTPTTTNERDDHHNRTTR